MQFFWFFNSAAISRSTRSLDRSLQFEICPLLSSCKSFRVFSFVCTNVRTLQLCAEQLAHWHHPSVSDQHSRNVSRLIFVEAEWSMFFVCCFCFHFSFLRSVLASNNLTGTIPSLANLIQIETLDLHNNSLSGTVPSLVRATSNSMYYLDRASRFVSFSHTFQHKQAQSDWFERESADRVCECNARLQFHFVPTWAESCTRVPISIRLRGMHMRTEAIVRIKVPLSW